MILGLAYLQKYGINGIYDTIENGTFHGEVRNKRTDEHGMEDSGTIEGGTFTESSNVINSGKITGGIAAEIGG